MATLKTYYTVSGEVTTKKPRNGTNSSSLARSTGGSANIFRSSTTTSNLVRNTSNKITVPHDLLAIVQELESHCILWIFACRTTLTGDWTGSRNSR
mmetsp:Transcript_12144/g.8484  ORF Transcript_12144/g.8484 Transcript_12144/m.8484 type:complete len:96 (-) Transcript_12144:382-669(-)